MEGSKMKLVKKILYVDDHGDRRKDLQDKIKAHDFEALIDVEESVSKIDTSKYVAVLIHQNNREYEDVFNQIVGEGPKQQLPMVKFSGGYTGPKKVYNSGMACICSASDVERNIVEFLRRYDDGGGVDLTIFIGYEPVLEAKLELLHRLLVPLPDLAVLEGEEAEWTKLLDAVENDRREVQNKQSYTDAWAEFKRANPAQYHSNPFDERYCGKGGLLNKLRDVLLPND